MLPNIKNSRSMISLVGIDNSYDPTKVCSAKSFTWLLGVLGHGCISPSHLQSWCREEVKLAADASLVGSPLGMLIKANTSARHTFFLQDSPTSNAASCKQRLQQV